jgi:two-component system OmpR family sensor kinase
MTSLSRRIIVATVALTAVSVGIAAGGVWMAARWQLLANLDAYLVGHFTRLSHLIQADRLHTPPRNLPTDPRNGNGTLYWRVINQKTGVELLHSPSLDDAAIPLEPEDGLSAQLPRWMRPPDGRDLRLLGTVVARSIAAGAPPSDSDAVPVPENSILVMAIDASATQRELSHVAIMLAALWVTACGLSVGASSWLRRAILRPVHHLAGAIRAIDLERLPATVDADVPLEMVVVRERLDDLLARLRQVLAREKGTIANIAHELRTPIAGLRTTLEFTALGGQPGGIEVANRCLPTVLAMQSMVSNLLTLARIEAGQETVLLQDIDLTRLVRDCWRSIEPLAAKRNTRIDEPAVGEHAMVRTCPDKARMVIANLLDNAVSHSPAGSLIAVALDGDAGEVRLHIGNPVSGQVPDAGSLFQPFWRGDQARGGGGLHCGLGLALCRRLVALLGGAISADTSNAGSFRIEVRFPRSVAVAAAASA